MSYSEADDLEFHKAEYERLISAISSTRGSQKFTRALDIGGGGAMHSAFLTLIAEKVYCLDSIDQNIRYGGEFIKLLREKFLRHNIQVNLERLEFHAGDAMDLIYKDRSFGLVVSFNAFEHIPDPGRAAAEVARVLEPDGVAFITFDPIWTCDTGSHFFHLVPKPWEHLLRPADEYVAQMVNAGANGEEVSDFRFAMNKVRLSTFRHIFRDKIAGMETISYREWSGPSDESHTHHANFQQAINAGYSEEELLTRGIEVVLRRIRS